MGRPLKRVPMDFNWPLNKVWEGYLNPYSFGKECPTCGGHGLNKATRQIDKDWYALDNPNYIWIDAKRIHRYNDNAHCYHLTQVEVDALLAHNRLRDLKEKLGRDPTVDEVNQWAIHSPLSHDGLNRWICVKARAMALGVYEHCPARKGEGVLRDSLEDKQKYEAWEPQEPPVGPGFQLWETTSEGSPQSPVFATQEELAEWCEENATVFGYEKTSAENWLKMLDEDNVHFREGNSIFI